MSDFAAPPPTEESIAAMKRKDDEAHAASQAAAQPPAKRHKRVARLESFLDLLPECDAYESSYMHRDAVTHCLVTGPTGVLATASADGHVKFWKKMQVGIEFVKAFHAHVGRVTDLAASFDGQWLATTGADGAAKLYDVSAFDMACIIRTKKDPKEPYIPGAACWLQTDDAPTPKVALCDAEKGGPVRVYAAPHFTLALRVKVHAAPVASMCFVPALNFVVSADARGMLEIWGCPFCRSGEAVRDAKAERPPQLTFKSKLDTDLYALAKAKAEPCRVHATRDGRRFAVTSTDACIRVFDTRSGKLLATIDESADAVDARRAAAREAAAAESSDSDSDSDAGPMPEPSTVEEKAPKPPRDAASAALAALDDLSYGRKGAVERELQSQTGPGAFLNTWNAVFDETGRYLLYGALAGIYVMNLAEARVERVLGVTDAERFGALALFEGEVKMDAQAEQARRKAAEAEGRQMPAQKLTMGAEQTGRGEADPTAFCCAFRRKRVYLLTRREPDEELGDGRDAQNELPTAEELGRKSAADARAQAEKSGSEAVLRTTMGDIRLKLYPHECPKTVENFSTHARNGYYDGLIFHRVIKSFMLQTGDPLGDGTGGESIWGGEFADEFHPSLRHNQPFTLSMANAGPGTNGSQFFITTVPTPWLDDKHTVFGKVTVGMEVCQAIENVSCNRFDKPYEDIKIINIEIS
mmetsp:Transcript_2339/g.6916  ORF Transcript_2339/g.6916 Transcript_2339/m.6916 type:complete len:697 (-) Transcript_2339:30-2120(-)